MDPKQVVEAMLIHPPVDPNNPILNSYPLDLKLINKNQQLDPPLMKAVKEDKRFSFTNLYDNELITYQPLRIKETMYSYSTTDRKSVV